MLKISVILLFCAFASQADITDEEGVLVFTNANFKQGISENEFVLVEFCKWQATYNCKATLLFNCPEMLFKVQALFKYRKIKL